MNDKKSNAPDLSAIVVIPDSYDTVRSVMANLRAQSSARKVEIVFVVASDRKFTIEETELSCFHSCSIVEVDRIKSISFGFVAGIRHANASIVALTEDHSFPDEKWADTFITAHRQPYAVVGPGMKNGNPDTLLSWADFYQAYGEWTMPVETGEVRHLPGHNSSYKRDILLSFGPLLDVLTEAESVLHRHLREQGYRLLLNTGTCTTHINFNTWAQWIPARYHTGRQFAATWSHNWSRRRRLLFTAGSVAIPFIRTWRVSRRILRCSSTGFLIRVSPIIFIGFVFEGIGHMLGYARGAGDSAEKVAKYDINSEETIIF